MTTFCSRGRPRLLYLPNEGQPGDQVGPRAAFAAMLAEGFLDGYEAFSFLCEARVLGSARAAMESLRGLADQFQPDVVLWQHVDSFDVARQDLQALKKISSRPTVVYHEGDVYGRLHKRLPAGTMCAASDADLVFLCGLGRFADLFRSAGAGLVLYAPNFADVVRFGTPWEPTEAREFDVVMIGNRVASRFPFLSLPGAAARQKLAQKLHDLLGPRFALFGEGWGGFPFDRGSIPFADQEKTIRRSWISVGWDHFDSVPYYFSNRLPIALLSGVAHVTNYRPGFEHIFGEAGPPLMAKSVELAVDAVSFLLSQPRQRLIELGQQGHDFARRHLTADKVLREMLRLAAAHHARRMDE